MPRIKVVHGHGYALANTLEEAKALLYVAPIHAPPRVGSMRTELHARVLLQEQVGMSQWCLQRCSHSGQIQSNIMFQKAFPNVSPQLPNTVKQNLSESESKCVPTTISLYRDIHIKG